MSDLQTRRFAEHVHEVVDLDAHGASLATIEERVNAMPADREEQSALWLLAFSLRNGAHMEHAGPDPLATHGHR